MKRRPEEILQRAVVQFLNLAAPKVVFWHVPNQKGTRKTWEQGLLKAMGLKAGVADLCLVLPGGRAAFIELKVADGKQRKEQAEFQAEAEAAGALYAICRSVDDVNATLKAWNAPMRGCLP